MTKGRLEAFSDGVIAIAITLLTIELPVPHGEHLWASLVDQWPAYLAYFVSFTIIGIMWVNHHAVLEVVRRTDRTLLMLNLWLLAFIALVPWTTHLVAENLEDADAHVAVAIYSANFIGTGIGFNAMWLWITRGPRLLRPGQDLARLRATRLRFGVGVGVYVVTLVVALVAPLVSMAMHALISLYYVADQLSISSDEDDAAETETGSEAGSGTASEGTDDGAASPGAEPRTSGGA